MQTIGDAVVYVAGLEMNKKASNETNSHRAYTCAMELIETAKKWHNDSGQPLIRVGMSCGTIFGGIISSFKFAFDIFGSAIDIAESLAAVGTPLNFSLSENSFLEILEEGDCTLNAPEISSVTGEISVYGTAVKYISFDLAM